MVVNQGDFIIGPPEGGRSDLVGTPDGIRDTRSLTTERLARSRRQLWTDYGLFGGLRVGTITSSARDVEQYCG